MNAPRRPSLWQRLSGTGPDPGPDFGDMGTAFGLDATMDASPDWDDPNVRRACEGGAAQSGNQAFAMDEYERVREQARQQPTAAPSGWIARFGGKALRRT